MCRQGRIGEWYIIERTCMYKWNWNPSVTLLNLCYFAQTPRWVSHVLILHYCACTRLDVLFLVSFKNSAMNTNLYGSYMLFLLVFIFQTVLILIQEGFCYIVINNYNRKPFPHAKDFQCKHKKWNVLCFAAELFWSSLFTRFLSSFPGLWYTHVAACSITTLQSFVVL